MEHIGTREIETDRLLLRRFTIDDAQAMFDNYANDEVVTRFLTWPVHENVELTQSLLNEWVKAYDNLNQYKWAITLKTNPSEVIGDISATITPSSEQIAACSIGYVLGQKHWGQGYMSEALTAVVRYLLTDGDFNRVFAFHDVANPASDKVMQKAGLQFEGIHRQGSLNNIGIVDTAQCAILKEDLKR